MKDLSKLWVRWVEPFVDSAPVYMCVSAENVVRSMRKAHPTSHLSDESMLDDFCVINWASVSERKP